MKDVGKVVLDKTGTITMGQPKVAEIIPMGDHNRDNLLQLVADVMVVTTTQFCRNSCFLLYILPQVQPREGVAF